MQLAQAMLFCDLETFFLERGTFRTGLAKTTGGDDDRLDPARGTGFKSIGHGRRSHQDDCQVDRAGHPPDGLVQRLFKKRPPLWVDVMHGTTVSRAQQVARHDITEFCRIGGGANDDNAFG
jgi:hypothetical protein